MSTNDLLQLQRQIEKALDELKQLEEDFNRRSSDLRVALGNVRHRANAIADEIELQTSRQEAPGRGNSQRQDP